MTELTTHRCPMCGWAGRDRLACPECHSPRLVPYELVLEE